MNVVDVINSFTIKYLKDRDDNLSIKDANKQNPIYQIFRITFGLTSKEFDALAKNLRMAVVCNDYLKEINSDLYLFSYELLSKLKENLKSVGLDELTIKNLIIKSPIIILFSDKLDNVFFLYKIRYLFFCRHGRTYLQAGLLFQKLQSFQIQRIYHCHK